MQIVVILTELASELTTDKKDIPQIMKSDTNTLKPTKKISSNKRDFINQEFKKYIDCKRKNEGKMSQSISQKGDSENIMQKGSICKRKDGRWSGRYYVNGKQKSVYARTKKECIEKLKECIRNQEMIETKDNRVSNKSITLNEWFVKWLETYKKPTLKESSYKILNMNYERYIAPSSLATSQVTKITSYELQDFLNNLKNVSAIKMCSLILSGMFDKLYRNALIKMDTMSLVVVTKKEKDAFVDINEISGQSENILSHEDEAKIKWADNEIYFKNLFYILLYTGLRIGEALGLTVNDIDFKNNYIIVNKQYNSTTNKISNPKSKSSNRKVPVFDAIRNILSDLCLGLKGDDYLFNHGLRHNKISAICKKNNVICTPHMLRKTFVSRCIYDMNIDSNVVKEWVGHESINVTSKHYTFASDDIIKANIDKINSIRHTIDT